MKKRNCKSICEYRQNENLKICRQTTLYNGRDNGKFSKIFSRQDWNRIGHSGSLYKALSHEKSKILNLPITGDIQFPLGCRPHCSSSPRGILRNPIEIPLMVTTRYRPTYIDPPYLNWILQGTVCYYNNKRNFFPWRGWKKSKSHEDRKKKPSPSMKETMDRYFILLKNFFTFSSKRN